jgi:hypothetical protein
MKRAHRRGGQEASSSSLLQEPATPISPSTTQTEPPRRRRRNPRRPMPTIGHTRQGQTAPTLDGELHKGNMLGLRRPRTLRSHRWPIIVAAWTRSTAAPTPQQHSEQKNPSDTPGHPTTEAQPRPNLSPTHHLCQTAHLDLAQLPGNNPLRRNPGRRRLRDDVPRRKETQQRLHRPIPDLRFPSGAKAAGVGESTTHDDASREVSGTRGRHHRRLRPKPEQGFLLEMLDNLRPESAARQPPPCSPKPTDR